jgi:N-formylglutamate amidohydrolase
MSIDEPPIWTAEIGEGATVACAIHDGHYIRPDVLDCLALSETQRLYEEDPYTAGWTTIASTRLIGGRSRFEFDLNRPREKAIYLLPADAWGLDIWRCSPSLSVVEESLRAYDAFYADLRRILERLVDRHGKVVVFDLHSYNHTRGGAGGVPADSLGNPEINLGTATMDRRRWSPVVDRWLEVMRASDYLGRRLDVRENVKFFGGQLPRWIHENFPHSVCALAIEVKKFFMNEWTGELDVRQHQAIGASLRQAAQAVEDAIGAK